MVSEANPIQPLLDVLTIRPDDNAVEGRWRASRDWNAQQVVDDGVHGRSGEAGIGRKRPPDASALGKGFIEDLRVDLRSLKRSRGARKPGRTREVGSSIKSKYIVTKCKQHQISLSNMQCRDTIHSQTMVWQRL
jgi:hypothetical protein